MLRGGLEASEDLQAAVVHLGLEPGRPGDWGPRPGQCGRGGEVEPADVPAAAPVAPKPNPIDAGGRAEVKVNPPWRDRDPGCRRRVPTVLATLEEN